jgi:hypothetical protein
VEPATPVHEPDVVLAADVGVASRPAESGHGVSYSAGFAYGGHIQVPLFRHFLRFSTYYAHLSQSIDVDRGALGGDAPVVPLGDLDSYVIGARLQPVLHFSDRLRVWANVGVAWGIMTAPALRVDAALPFQVGPHGAAYVEFPFGVGGEFDFWPRWAGITADLTAGPGLNGFDLGTPQQTIDASGRLIAVRSLPPTRSVWSATAGLTIHL